MTQFGCLWPEFHCGLRNTGKFAPNMEVIWNYLGVLDNSTHKQNEKCLSGFQDYSPRSSHCYMLISQYAATWENANQFCNLKHGALIMPKNKQQSGMIKNIIHKEKRGIAFWIGLRKRRDHLKHKNTLNVCI